MPRRRDSNRRIAEQGLRMGAGVTARIETGALLDAMPEREFQAVHLVEGLKRRGWIVWTVPRMQMTREGLPDVTAYHPRLPGLLLCWELKRQVDSRTSDAQRRALEHLATVPGIDARIVRPADWAGPLRDVIDDTSRDPRAALKLIPRGF